MVHGAFRTFVHDHLFEASGDSTAMRDVVQFSAPFRPLGALVERFVLRRHMEIFLCQRNEVIRSTAEADQQVWRPFLPLDRI